MTAPHRPLPILVVALMLPACVQIGTAPNVPLSDQTAKWDASQKTDQVRKTSFAELLSRPGVVVPIKLTAKETPAPQPMSADPEITVVATEQSVPLVNQAPATPLPEPPLLKAVRAFTEGRLEQAIEALSPYDKANQDLILAVLPVLDRVSKLDMKADPTTTAYLAEQLHSAAARIETRAALRLEAVSLCKRADGYGRYEPLPKGEPYRPNNTAQLYIEVRNLVSQPTVGPHGETYLTLARETVEIRDAYGKLIDQPTSDGRYVSVVHAKKELYTRTPIREFHILYPFQVPSTPGVYTISITIQDPAGRRSIKTEPIEFTVAGP